MNPIESVETRYAILLPDGKLSSDLPEARVGGEKYTTLPDKTNAYTWEHQESAEWALGRMVNEAPFGTGELLERHSSVVELRITYRVEVVEPIAEAEDAGAPEPRRWAKVDDIPYGVKFKGATGGLNVWERSFDDRIAVGLNPRKEKTAAYLDELDADFPGGFVEVLP